MSPTIAVAHYPEGAGHATRMLAIADAIESAGGSVRMAGGGAGSEFVALNGYDAFEPTIVDFIDTYQGGSLWQTARRSVPASLSRIVEYEAWLSATDPDALVTDDMFAAMAATRRDVPLYVLKHDMPGLYDDATERAGARFHTLFQLSAAREFFYPVVWPESTVDPERATRIPPVALDGDAPVSDGPDVVVVPSHYSSLSRLATHLRRQGYDVLDVADDDWDAVPSLLPYIRAADCVVCSGYSTIMDAAVAGTPCVVHPATDEQRAVADWLERFDARGFTVASDPIDVLDAVADPPGSPTFDNGAAVIARRVLTDLRDPDPFAAPAPDDARADEPRRPERSGLRSLAAVPTLAVVRVATAGSLVTPSRLHRRLRATIRGVGTTGGRAIRGGWNRGRTVASAVTTRVKGSTRIARAVTGHLAAGASRCRDAVERCRPDGISPL
jgi:hypothetical protein